jgi:hypothetical protein
MNAATIIERCDMLTRSVRDRRKIYSRSTTSGRESIKTLRRNDFFDFVALTNALIGRILVRVSRFDRAPRLPMPGYAGGSASVKADHVAGIIPPCRSIGIDLGSLPSPLANENLQVESHTGKPLCNNAGRVSASGLHMNQNRRIEI